MRVLVIQHVPFEGPANLKSWAEERGHSIRILEIYRSEDLPKLESWDLLFILGGPMGVYDISIHPWLTIEKRYIRKAILAQRRVVGICLGAQLLAEALGGRVHKNKEREIGWHKINLIRTKHNCLWKGIPDEPIVFQWHGDTFDLPPHARLLASSEACIHQSFIYDQRVLALQFHLESTNESIQKLCQNCKNDLSCGNYVQTPVKMLDQNEKLLDLKKWNHALLDNFIKTSGITF
jgi:GMP synthase-like glutamine amidotransferase